MIYESAGDDTYFEVGVRRKVILRAGCIEETFRTEDVWFWEDIRCTIQSPEENTRTHTH